jgi:amino acid adenylation domain-containing protein
VKNGGGTGSHGAMNDVSQRLRDLTPDERKTLRAKLTERRNLVGRVAPLSYSQQRLWFLEQLVTKNAYYNETSALYFGFPVDSQALKYSLNDIVRRHEVLRTVFEATDGEPRQRVLPNLELALPILDLRGASERRESEAVRVAKEQGQRPFDLVKGPLLRVSLIQFGTADFVFVLTMHHIVCDGWSMKVLFEELGAFYEQHVGGKAAVLPMLQIQYADFAIWQREWLNGQVLERQLAFWRDQLADVAVLDLPTDFPRPVVPTFSGNREQISISADVYAGLKRVSKQEKTTPFMVLLAVYQILLHRYTDQDDVAVGSPIANRCRPELENLIGFFVNTLVFRTDLSGNPSFREVLRRVREVALSAYAHQDVPFEKLVQELQPKRDPTRNPLFQVTFQMLSAPATAQEASDLLPRSVDVEMQTAKFDLRCDLWDAAGGVDGYFEYSTDLFAAETIRAMARHFEKLVESAARTPNSHISDLSMLAATEEQRLLVDWNRTAVNFSSFDCVHQRFESCAAEYAIRIAVSETGSEITYGELNCRSNQLARYLKSRGVVPGSLVAVLLDCSVDYVLAIIAILKAGGAYVPLDPTCPEQRLAAIMKDAVVQLVLTNSRYSVRVPGYITQVHLDTDRYLWDTQKDSNLVRQVDGRSLAYVIFTSGSTGRSKGVEVMHSSLINLVCWHNREYEITPQDRATLYASPAFDASVWEMWPYLTSGASLSVPDKRVRTSSDDLAKWMIENEITISFLPTPMAENLIDLDLPRLPRLRILLTGGDKLRRYPRRPIPFRFLNHYGPTENTVVATFAEVSQGGNEIPPIGKPIANVQAFVLDRRLHPVPRGVKGELYLGGGGLARGYLNNAALTKERFMPNPFDRRPGRLLYRTGDLVRYRLDGSLEFHGRVDRQIKVRGFRIEPGEIEAALDQHPAVRKSLVVSREGAFDNISIVAYLIPTYGEQALDGMSLLNAEAERVREWEKIYEDIYSIESTSTDPVFNIIGWNSSYTGQPLSEAEMREQVDGTVQRIRELGGRRMLEIGCGTGLLLFQLAELYERYVATDFSASVVASVRSECERRGLQQVEVLERGAEDFSGIDAGTFDVVVLNSVVQYFPSMDYLVRVLAAAVRAVRPGGWVFVGDVRSLPLLKWLHAGVELARSSEEVSAVELRERLEQRLNQEQELVIEPDFFVAWGATEPEVGNVKLEVKRGWHHNELTKFRYDVALQVGEGGSQLQTWEKREWEELGSVAALARYLRDQQPMAVLLRDVPNRRLGTERRLMEQLERGDAGLSARQLRQAMTQVAGQGVEPEELWALERDSNYALQVSWSASGSGGYDIWCVAKRDAGENRWTMSVPASPRAEQKPWSAYANQTLGQATYHQLAQQLRDYLRERLPEYMVPSQFVWLERLPLTSNGKLDRRALPAPDQQREMTGASYLAPRGQLEEQIASVWSQVLGVERISIDANFFDAGGHSLLATQVVSRLSETLHLDIPLRLMFERPTIASLAESLNAFQTTAPARTSSILAITEDFRDFNPGLSNSEIDTLLTGLPAKGRAF